VPVRAGAAPVGRIDSSAYGLDLALGLWPPLRHNCAVTPVILTAKTNNNIGAERGLGGAGARTGNTGGVGWGGVGWCSNKGLFGYRVLIMNTFKFKIYLYLSTIHKVLIYVHFYIISIS
jgi:hypothetical protein